MVATLRVVLDQIVSPTDPDIALASRELTLALIDAQPAGCEVEGIVPAAPAGRIDEVAADLGGIARLHKVALARRELSAAMQLGVGTGIGGGMIHSPSLFAPLVKHDRVHDRDQTVVTVWDLGAWETPGDFPRVTVAWQRAMLKRAARHADAIVVPTHGMAEKVSEFAALGDRVRVIAGAAATGFSVPSDEIGRRRVLGVPEGFVLLSAGAGAGAGSADLLSLGLSALAHSGLDVPVVVLDAAEGQEPAIVDLASAAGIPERRVHVRGRLETMDRAAVFGAALALLAPSSRTVFPWRVIEALALGVPVVAVDSPIHREVMLDGGLRVEADAVALGEALGSALGSTVAAERLAVLSGDRGRVFSWRGAAERVWSLHADL